MLRFRIVAFLDDVALGAEFAPDALPVHLEVLPVAETSADLGQLEAALELAYAQFAPFEATGGDDELTASGDEVTLVDDDGELRAAHLALVRELRPLGVRVADPRTVGTGYRPAVPVGEDRIERGERLDLDAIALLEDVDGTWTVAAQLPLI